MADRYEEKARAVADAIGDYSRSVFGGNAVLFSASKAVELIAAALREQDAWLPIETAPKDGTRILAILKNPIPKLREDLRAWDGIPFVARHPGLADNGFDIGWNFAAPVGSGGFPDEWIAGWRPLPPPPPDTGRAQR